MLALTLVGLALLVLALEGWSRGRSSYHRTGPGSDRSPKVVELGRWRWPAFALCGLVVGLSLALPTGLLLHWLVRGVLSGEPMLLLWSAARNSVVASGLAAVVAAGLSVPMAALIVRYPSPLSRLLERISFIGYSLPGIVVALALAFFGANFAQPLYQTTWLLVFAYVVLLFPAALGATRASLHQVSPRLEEAARGLGRTPGQAIRNVTVPLVRPGLMMGAALVFLVAMKELPATLILSPLGFETLATAVWSASSEAFFARAAAPALTLILVSSIPMAYLILRERAVSPGSRERRDVNGPVVECRGVTKHYGEVRAVERVDLALQPGETISILGPSGCGKTTTLRLIAGFELPDAGEISICGEVVSGPGIHVQPDRRSVGMVFQEYALFPHKTVAENVSFGLNRLTSHERDLRTREVIDLVRLSGLEERYPHELSGGQQQRVALAADDRAEASLGAAGRAVQQPGRGDASVDAARGAGDPAGERDRGDIRHPRPRGGVRDGRPGGGDERRTAGADRRAGRHLPLFRRRPSSRRRPGRVTSSGGR